MKSIEQVAVITGAASGIGFALTEVCLRQGIHVVMADNAVAVLQEKVDYLHNKYQAEVIAVVCDVTKKEDLENLAKRSFDRFQKVNWLFNNAGIIGPLAPLWELEEDDLRKVVDINLFGVIHGIQVFLPHLFQQNHRSHLINMASLYGLCSGSQLAAYAMTKHAIVALSESLYFDLQRLEKPVDVSVVCPSFTSTGLLSNSAPSQAKQLHSLMSDLVARSRSPSEVAEQIVRDVFNKQFYILPDKEVKNYCEERNKAIIHQSNPHQHSIEKLMMALSRRAEKI